MRVLLFQGYTALHLASIHGHQRLVHALIHLHSESDQLTRVSKQAQVCFHDSPEEAPDWLKQLSADG